MKLIADCSFVVVVNGRTVAPPASGIVEYLVKQGARSVASVLHPLEPEDPGHHVVTTYRPGREPHERVIRLPSRPPYTYPLDLVVPMALPRADVWFAFNNLACLRGLVQRRLRRAGRVVYWPVDFVADRFGPTVTTRAYDLVDRICCTRADARFELAEAALRARGDRHRLRVSEGAPTRLVPIGAWVNEVPAVPEDGMRARRVLFLGHLVERTGVGLLPAALARLRSRGIDVAIEVAGSGPLEAQLRRAAAQEELAGSLRLVGYIDRQADVRRFLASGSLGVAMYSPTDNAVTKFADPGKLKAYLAAGLPTIITEVPHNARELAARGGATIIPYDADALADSIEEALASEDRWRERRRAALTYAQGFDWSALLQEPLRSLGFKEPSD